MRQSRTRARLANNEAVRICCLGHFMPAFVRHAADSGFDCIWLDFEHRCWTDREIQAILPLFHLYDIDCLLRVPTTEKTRLYRYLEDGATGLMVPHVSTVEAARELVESVKFPPIGNRGLDAAGLDCDFSLPEHVEYVREANEQTMLVVQIETPEAVENVEAIAALEGVDGLFIGPGDLGMRLALDETTEMTVESATERVAAAAAAAGKAWGRPAATELMGPLFDQGARLLAHGGDFGAIMDHLRECGGHFDDLAAGAAANS